MVRYVPYVFPVMLAGSGVQPFGTQCYRGFAAVIVKDGHVIHSDFLHVSGQTEALRSEEKATDGMDICERVDWFEMG